MSRERTAFETKTISSTAVGLSPATYAPTNADPFSEATITVETADIRFRIDGEAPTSAIGHLVEAGNTIVLESAKEIKFFKAIAAGSDAAISVTYKDNEPYAG